MVEDSSFLAVDNSPSGRRVVVAELEVLAAVGACLVDEVVVVGIL